MQGEWRGIAQVLRAPLLQTLDSWSCERRVVGKAEWLPGPRGSNPRFVVSNIPKDWIGASALYPDLYCARGDMENRIKEQQLDLFADRTSAHTMRANQHGRRLGLCGCCDPEHPQVRAARHRDGEGSGLRDHPRSATEDAGSIRVTTRTIWISLSSVYPWHKLFMRVVRNLAAAVSIHCTQRPRNAHTPPPLPPRMGSLPGGASVCPALPVEPARFEYIAKSVPGLIGPQTVLPTKSATRSGLALAALTQQPEITLNDVPVGHGSELAVGASIGQVRLPIVHEATPPLEQVRAPVGGPDLVAHDVCKRRLRHG